MDREQARSLQTPHSDPTVEQTDSFSRGGTVWHDPQPLPRSCLSSSHRPCLKPCPFPTPALYICPGSRATSPHQTRLPATLVKACIVTRTTDVIRTHLRPTRSPAPAPRRLMPNPNDSWLSSSTKTKTTTTNSNNRSTHYHPTGPNGLSQGTLVGTIIRQ